MTELVCHPGIGDRELESAYRWGYGWDGETAALCDPGVKKAIREGGIELSGFLELGGPGCGRRVEGGQVPSDLRHEVEGRARS